MVNANELRLGNFVTNKDGVWLRVASIGSQRLTARYKKHFTAASIEEFSGIAMQPEIFQLFGFTEKILPKNWANGMNGWEIPIMQSAGRYLMVCGFLSTVYEGNNIFDGMPSGDVYALHDLQNLYFTHTRKELKITK